MKSADPDHPLRQDNAGHEGRLRQKLPPSPKRRRNAEALSAFAKRYGETSTKLEERSRG